MAFDGKSLDDYIDVPTRMVEFKAKYPEASLQPANLDEPFKIVEVAGATFIVYVAAAYRSPDDSRPGIGSAWEPVPGRTPYTRNSELMNAETSAWGRAIVAALAADAKKGIASAEEVRNRREERADDKPQRPKNNRRPAKQEPPDEQKTDHAWLEVIEQQIRAAQSRQELVSLANEIRAKKQAGACEPVHEEHLWTLGTRRQEELDKPADGLPRNRDGSISRSQLTDEERAAAGLATRQEAKEMGRLERDTLAEPKKAERSTEPNPDDPWQVPPMDGDEMR